MKSLFLVALWLVFSVLAAALLTPWLYLACGNLADQYPSLDWLAGHKFHRFFNRVVMIFALAGIFPLGRCLGYTTWRSLGFGGTHRGGRFAVGFVSSFAFIGTLALAVLLSGRTVPDPGMSALFLLKALAVSAATGLVVGLAEEIFFRGFLYDVTRREMNQWAAVILVSIFYSILHFVKSPGGYETGEIRWDSMFRLLPLYLNDAQNLDRLFFGFTNLFIAGWMLAWAYQATGNLHLSVGMHAGWVFALKLNGSLTEWAPGAPEWLFGFGGDLSVSPLGLLVLIAQWIALQKLSRQLIVLGP